MDTPSPSPTSARPTDRVLEVLVAEGGPMRTETIAARLPDLPNATVRLALSRLGKRDRIESPTYGVWAVRAAPRASRPPHPRAEIVLPGATSDELLTWAENITEANPISMGIPPFRPSGHLTISDRPFMGVELTFVTGDKPVFTLAVFADIPNEQETQIMDENHASEGAVG